MNEQTDTFRAPGLLIVLMGCIAMWTTVALADARPGRTGGTTAAPVDLDPLEALGRISAEAAAVDARAAEATAPEGTDDASTSVSHPLLPPALAALDDGVLSSAMLHHPPFAAEVERWIGFWSNSFSDWMPVYLSRMTSFESMVDETLAAHGLPWSLRYLPVIESGYSPGAVSSAKAVGLWQFMAPTAVGFGIEVSDHVDDRRDPFVSTDAAAKYLVELREEFGSWFLALAAYNAGPDRIKGLLERYLPDVEPSDAAYWSLRNVLPDETAAFVPNLLGAIVVASDPAAHGYALPEPVPFDFESVPVLGSISFEGAARAASASAEEIARLNPEYVRGVTPPGRQVELRLPPGRSAAFRAFFATDDPASGR